MKNFFLNYNFLTFFSLISGKSSARSSGGVRGLIATLVAAFFIVSISAFALQFVYRTLPWVKASADDAQILSAFQPSTEISDSLSIGFIKK